LNGALRYRRIKAHYEPKPLAEETEGHELGVGCLGEKENILVAQADVVAPRTITVTAAVCITNRGDNLGYEVMD
jgi:hypothetical protein